MRIETPPATKPYARPEGERRGLLIVHTGDGKGKSTAAFGLALRAHGRGKAVKVYQFMKVPSARFGEHRVFEQLGIPMEGLGDGFSWKSQDLEHSAQLARERLLNGLRAEGVQLRDAAAFGLPGRVRLNALPPASQQALAEALRRVNLARGGGADNGVSSPRLPRWGKAGMGAAALARPTNAQAPVAPTPTLPQWGRE